MVVVVVVVVVVAYLWCTAVVEENFTVVCGRLGVGQSEPWIQLYVDGASYGAWYPSMYSSSRQ